MSPRISNMERFLSDINTKIEGFDVVLVAKPDDPFRTCTPYGR